MLDVDQADSTAFFALHPKERQVCIHIGHACRYTPPDLARTAVQSSAGGQVGLETQANGQVGMLP